MLQYIKVNDLKVKVYASKRLIGTIMNKMSWRYFPEGESVGGEPFKTLNECKKSLED